MNVFKSLRFVQVSHLGHVSFSHLVIATREILCSLSRSLCLRMMRRLSRVIKQLCFPVLIFCENAKQVCLCHGILQHSRSTKETYLWHSWEEESPLTSHYFYTFHRGTFNLRRKARKNTLRKKNVAICLTITTIHSTSYVFAVRSPFLT